MSCGYANQNQCNQTDRQTDRHTDRQTDRHIYVCIQTDGQTNIHTCIHAGCGVLVTIECAVWRCAAAVVTFALPTWGIAVFGAAFLASCTLCA